MNGHKVLNVSKLYEDSRKMYTNVVAGSDNSANKLIDTLGSAISTLKSSWKGVDAGVQINSVITVYNALVVLRNSLAQFASDSASVAVKYRAIQAANSQSVEEFSSLNVEMFNVMSEYTDNADTVDITPEALNGKNNISTVVNTLNTFLSSAELVYGDIMDNWQAGAGRESGVAAFADFKSKVSSYSNTLNEVCTNITTALSNYGLA